MVLYVSNIVYILCALPLYPKISTQNCMHIRGSKCGCTHSTNICPCSKCPSLRISKLIWDMLGHFMSKKRHHFCHFYTFSTIITIHVNVISAMLVLHSSLDVYYFITTSTTTTTTTSVLLPYYYMTTTLLLHFYYLILLTYYFYNDIVNST
ncbi:hypothetical protein PFNF54_01985 [Plasmodium falciparum NF54]|uniref:Uncharacterized protein n=1 Tax=Plasmodium falciparum (isolate NF54) TaxID=5843 RepID=W7K6X7_PLAFO|nr:hypothetical protein PFNF54_01985 [Plasmodium falciparum NF54]